jgi:hypothetical protein
MSRSACISQVFCWAFSVASFIQPTIVPAASGRGGNRFDSESHGSRTTLTLAKGVHPDCNYACIMA